MADPRNTDSTRLGTPFVARSACRDERVGDHFIAPLGSAKRGLLRFTGGAHRVAIRADPLVRGLCRARFGHRMPMVGVREGVITVRYPRFPAEDWLDCRSESPAEVALSDLIPWDVEVRGGVSRLVADLDGLRLGSLDVNGGASRLEVILPVPVGTVAVVVNGGANNVTIARPERVAARLRVEGGVTHLRFDDRRVSAAGGDLDLQSQDYEVATDRYDIVVTGGANNVGIDKQRVCEE